RGRAGVAWPVVAAARARRRELPGARRQALAAPPPGGGGVVARVGGVQLAHPRLELLAACDDLALRRGERAQAAAARARARVRLRLLARDARHRPLDAHLPAELLPVEEQRRLRVRLQLAALAAAVVREEDEPALVVALEQDHPDAGRALRGRGRERHRL